ncbi:preprotein translocase subunit SecF [bacterium BMS3Bbin06]|nr:preprotein translocase subunit SecF [bacterium BMS3Bbin06]HDO35849.1 protein translocase subunit SecF [Nitrospirota bacterium]HDY70648.1 protein translocase subunit SecF [Nitrospirota bacterium]
MIEIIKKTNIDFMGLKKYTFIISGILVISGIIAIIQIVTGSANLGIDFVGGTAVQLKFEKQVPIQDVRHMLESAGIKDFDLQEFPTVNKVLIRIKQKEETLGKFSQKIISTLRNGFKGNKITVDSTIEIGPKVGAKLRQDALWAILAATLGILLYIAWRFQFSFSIGATAATAHDVLAVLGLFNIMGIEINLIVVSALLTIAGYSLTDTVVVFDRIRENLRYVAKESIVGVINRSINEVLSRTIVTSVTTLLAALALFLFGGEVIHYFALAMILGISVGTYSSVFVASPIVLLWKGKKPLSIKK